MLAYIYPFIYTSCMFTLVLAYKDRVLSCERSSIGQFPRYLSDFFFLLSNSQITKVQRDSFRWNILIRLIDLYQNIRLNPGKLLSVIRHKRLAINGTLSKYDAIRFSWSNAYSHQSLNTFLFSWTQCKFVSIKAAVWLLSTRNLAQTIKHK